MFYSWDFCILHDMEDKFNEIIIEHFGLSVFIMVVAIAVIIGLTWWCAMMYIKIKKIDELPCEKHNEKMSEHDNAVSRLNTSITFLTKEIDSAMRMFQQQHIKTDQFTQTKSPLSITEAGWDMVKRLGLEKMFGKNWSRIKELIDANVKDKNAYDIDAFCVQQAVVFPEKFLSDNEISILKDDAFKNGLTLTSYMKVIAVMARDKYLQSIKLKSNP